jgi:hypothetical protein
MREARYPKGLERKLTGRSGRSWRFARGQGWEGTLTNGPPRPPQGLPAAPAAAERAEGDAAELCRLPQAAALAVVAPLHQGRGQGGRQRTGDFLCWSLSFLYL